MDLTEQQSAQSAVNQNCQIGSFKVDDEEVSQFHGDFGGIQGRQKASEEYQNDHDIADTKDFGSHGCAFSSDDGSLRSNGGNCTKSHHRGDNVCLHAHEF